MPTAPAFALGLLALFGRRVPEQVRAFLLTALVVDDVVALVVIATVYSGDVELESLVGALGVFLIPLTLLRFRIRYGPAYFVSGVAVWLALLSSGIDPI